MTEVLASHRPTWRTRVWLAGLILLLLASAYGSLCLWFVAHDFQFGDQRLPRVSPGSVGLTGFAAVEITTEDGERLDAWWAPPPEPGRGVVLFLHGTPRPGSGGGAHQASSRSP